MNTCHLFWTKVKLQPHILFPPAGESIRRASSLKAAPTSAFTLRLWPAEETFHSGKEISGYSLECPAQTLPQQAFTGYNRIQKSFFEF